VAAHILIGVGAHKANAADIQVADVVDRSTGARERATLVFLGATVFETSGRAIRISAQELATIMLQGIIIWALVGAASAQSVTTCVPIVFGAHIACAQNLVRVGLVDLPLRTNIGIASGFLLTARMKINIRTSPRTAFKVGSV